MSPQLRTNYSFIVKGQSATQWQDRPVFFKHLSHTEIGEFSILESAIYKDAHGRGLLNEKERLEYLKKESIWTEINELELQSQRDFLENRFTTKKNLIVESQIQQVNKDIEETQKKIDEISAKRSEYLGLTTEKYVLRKMNEHYIRHSSYKDRNLVAPLFTDEEFAHLEDEELESLIIIYNDCLEELNNTVKKLALSPLLQNLYNLSSESVFEFYGKPLINLTIYQIDLYSLARFFVPIVSGENKPPPELLEDPDKLIEWHTKSKNLRESVHQSDTLGGSTVFGAKAKDYQDAGVQGKFVNFRSMMKPGQTEMDVVQLANIFKKA